MLDNSKLRIAIQKSGRLCDDSKSLFTKCGIKINLQQQKLIAFAENMPIDILRVRDDDIPGLVIDGVVDLGIVGENVLEEQVLSRQAEGENPQFKKLRRLDFGDCRLSIAAPHDFDYSSPHSLHNMRVATTYPHLLRRYLSPYDVKIKTCMLNGSVEVATRAGLADVICDLVSSGATLEANGLREINTIFESKACIIQRSGRISPEKLALINKLMTRIQGVIQARESKYIMLHAPKDKFNQIIDLLPGVEKPTISPLAYDEHRIALHVVSTESLFWETMEKLKSLGASSILVLPIEKMME